MRLILAAIVIIGSAPALAAPMGPPLPVVSKVTPARQAIALYRDEYRHGYVACPTPTRANEVVICGNGRGGSANRIPLPDERTPPDWARRPIGEVPSAAGALTTTSTACVSADCSGSGAVNLVQAATTLVQLGRAIVDPEGASDYADRHPR